MNLFPIAEGKFPGLLVLPAAAVGVGGGSFAPGTGLGGGGALNGAGGRRFADCVRIRGWFAYGACGIALLLGFCQGDGDGTVFEVAAGFLVVLRSCFGDVDSLGGCAYSDRQKEDQ